MAHAARVYAFELFSAREPRAPRERRARRMGGGLGWIRRDERRPRGFTLVELLMALTITATLSVVLGGLVMAVQTARDYSEGTEEATAQAQAAIDRIKFMVAQAGVYQAGGQPTMLGLAVVNRMWFVLGNPEVLVVWSGGREGGLADAGVQSRLPRINELVLYTPDPQDANRLVEMTFPGNSTEIDFRAPNFDDTIQNLLPSPAAERLLLCDRLRRTDLPQGESPDDPAAFGNVRFELSQSPDDAALAATAPGTQAWGDLRWAQGIAASDLGMRQANLRIELQVNLHRKQTDGLQQAEQSVPFFGSASYRYVYRP